jgi:Mor family transcriptional regulator
METGEFLRKYIITDIRLMQENNLHLQSVQLLTLSIEFLGGLLDGKPLKSEQQSKKRFNSALKQLFPGKYYYLNKDYFLYDSLRNQLIHAFSPGGKLLLCKANSNLKHLETHENKLVIVIEVFYEDVKKACEKIIEMIEEDKIRHKHIPVDIFQSTK